ncbi:MAG: hypothetical protein U0174_13210 [Polyangiaceae bacterium]
MAALGCGANAEPASGPSAYAVAPALVSTAVPTFSTAKPSVIAAAPAATATALTAQFAPSTDEPAKASVEAAGAIDPVVGDLSDERLKALVVEHVELPLGPGETPRKPCLATAGYLKLRVDDEKGKNPLFLKTPVKTPSVDVDRDGKIDKFVILGASTDAYDVLLLLDKGKCVIPIGALSAFEEVRALSTSHHGLRDFASSTRCEKFGSCDVEWHFDGKGYVEANEKQSKRRSVNGG